MYLYICRYMHAWSSNFAFSFASFTHTHTYKYVCNTYVTVDFSGRFSNVRLHVPGYRSVVLSEYLSRVWLEIHPGQLFSESLFGHPGENNERYRLQARTTDDETVEGSDAQKKIIRRFLWRHTLFANDGGQGGHRRFRPAVRQVVRRDQIGCFQKSRRGKISSQDDPYYEWKRVLWLKRSSVFGWYFYF